ncbi:MAG: DUF2182 domain-containing protein, partial [Pseudomonadota bacterium]|nr:DUF2182 domain-containing protein [Pseudomonadota bacterium]
WGLFGIIAHLADLGLYLLAAEAVQAGYGWVHSAAVVALAGAFQFSALKYRCLDKCRAPLGFVISHWRGGSHWRGSGQGGQAWLLGVHHGLYCIGCCWALMALMFVAGTASVGGMLLLGAVMAAEKNLPWGRRLAAPLGVLLLAWAAGIVAVHIRP